MQKLLTLVFMIILIQSCNRNTDIYIDDPGENKIALIDIDTVYKSITNDSIIFKIGFKNIPNISIPFEYLSVEIVFDVNNDTLYENDLSLDFDSFISDTIDSKINMTIKEIVENSSIKAIFKYSPVIQSGKTYRIQKTSYCSIENIVYSHNYLIFRLSKRSCNLLGDITDSLNWQVQARYGDGLADRINDDKYNDFFSPFYDLEERNK